MNVPQNFRTLQTIAGIWKEHRDVFLEEIEPRDGQANGLQAVKEMMEGRRRLLVLVGESRSGKSFLLSGFANSVMRRDYREGRDESVKYMTFFDFELALRTAQTLGRMDVLYKELSGYPHLVVDELGRGKWSDFTATFFTNLLIRRRGEFKDTMIATNLSGSELKEMLDIALIERLREENGIVAVKKT